MIKVPFPAWGVGFISYEDSECFDFLLNVHTTSDRMMRAKDAQCDFATGAATQLLLAKRGGVLRMLAGLLEAKKWTRRNRGSRCRPRRPRVRRAKYPPPGSMEHTWKQKAASGNRACMSRWQFRKLVRHQKHGAMSSSGASFDQQDQKNGPLVWNPNLESLCTHYIYIYIISE